MSNNKVLIDAVTVRFLPREGDTSPPSTRTYTYKALRLAQYRPGMTCIVDVPRKGISEVEVISISDFESLPPVAFEYKWIVAGCSVAEALWNQDYLAVMGEDVDFAIDSESNDGE
jgi:hypothetical protein